MLDNSTIMEYNKLGRQVAIVDAKGNRTQMAYDAVGQLLSRRDALGNIERFSYDKVGNQITRTDAGQQVTSYLYDALNRVTKKTLANGVVEKHTFDHAGRETSIEYRTASNVLLASFVSTYDAAGNRLSVTEADGSVTSYSYDADDQLLSEERTGTHPYFISYAYDALGNRTSKVENGVATTYVYAAANRLMSEQTAGSSLISYGYDALGQCTSQTQDGAATLYGWSPLGQMFSVTAPDSSSEFYSYCGDGIRRTKQTDEGTRLFIRDGQNILLEADAGTNATLRRYTHEGDNWGGLLSLHEGSTSRYYGFDGSANTRLLTDESAGVSDGYLYSAFGEELQVTGTSANPLRFGGEVGYYQDDDERLYVRARHLDVGAGRWLSRDPIGFEGGDWNLYRYVGNSPLDHIDPNGLQSTPTPQPLPTPPPSPRSSTQTTQSGSISRPGEDWRLFYIFAFSGKDPQYVVRMTGGNRSTPSAAQAARNGIIPNGEKIQLNPVEHVLNEKVKGRSPYTSASTLRNGASQFKGEPIWIDVNKLKKGSVLSYKDIVKASVEFLKRNEHLRARFNIWKSAQVNEGEVLIKGRIPSSAISTRNQVRLKTSVKVGGKVLFLVAVAADTAAFFDAENKSRELARIAGGWAGAWVSGRVGAAVGAKAGAAVMGVVGVAGPQAAAPEEVVTIPAGAAVGGIIGGVGGGIAGYRAGSEAGRRYYEFIKRGLRK